MKMKNKFFRSLIESNNPFPVLWKFMINRVWKSQENLNSFYGQESKVLNLERTIHRVFDEVYTELLPKYCTGKDYKLKIDHPIIFLDSLSIREGVLFQKAFDKEDVKCELKYSFSSIPSSTVSYKKKVNYKKLKKENKSAKIQDITSWEIDGDEKLIWSDFPDALIEDISKGRTKTGEIGEVYEETRKLAFDILNQINAKKIEFRSDHGYIRLPGAYTFEMPSRDSNKLKKIFGSKRYVLKSEVEEDISDIKKYIVDYEDYYMVKARYTWPLGGKVPTLFQHGGVSLMECMTPRLVVCKQ